MLCTVGAFSDFSEEVFHASKLSKIARVVLSKPLLLPLKTPPYATLSTSAQPVIIEQPTKIPGHHWDYVVKLIDVFPDVLEDYPDNDDNVPMEGYQMLVRGDILRGRFRNSFENPEPFTPGEVTRVSFTIPDVAHTFQEGHRLMIQVQNSWFPLVDRNPQTFVNIYEAEEADFQKATHRIYHEADLPSRVQLHIFKD